VSDELNRSFAGIIFHLKFVALIVRKEAQNENSSSKISEDLLQTFIAYEYDYYSKETVPISVLHRKYVMLKCMINVFRISLGK